MPSRLALRLLLGVVTSFAFLAACQPLLARHEMSEEQLQARLDHEQKPVKKAKLLIQMAQLKYSQAAAAYDHGDTAQGDKLLDAECTCYQQAWDLLKTTRRDANRKPGGFKELDIALRESVRRLEDLRHRIPYLDRGALDNISKTLNQTHNAVLGVLFPGGSQLGNTTPRPPADPKRGPEMPSPHHPH